MKGIRTKYLPATNYRPSRIVATAEGGCRIVVSYPDELDMTGAHAFAAVQLCRKYGWLRHRLASGGSVDGTGQYFVFVGPDLETYDPRDGAI